MHIIVAVENATSLPIRFAVDECGLPAAVSALVRLPIKVSPADATPAQPTGVPVAFRDFVLAKAFGPGGAALTAPIRIQARATKCADLPQGYVVEAGGAAEVGADLPLRLASDLGLPAGPVTYEVTADYSIVLVGATGTEAPIAAAKQPSSVHVAAEGSLSVIGSAPALVAAEAAIETLLANNEFAKWLEGAPSESWSTANVLLVSSPTGEGIVPKGTSWEIDLFRERGVPRSWAIGFVDPATGSVRSISYCNAPCDR